MGSSGNEDHSAPNPSPDSWDVRFLVCVRWLRGLRCNLAYVQPSYDYLLESTRGF